MTVEEAIAIADENYRKCKCLDCEALHVMAMETRRLRMISHAIKKTFDGPSLIKMSHDGE